MRTLIEFICLECGGKAKGRPSRVKNGRAKYCGVSCANRARAKHLHKTRDFFGDSNPNYKGDKALTGYEQKLRQKKKYPERVKARQIAYDALRRGKLVRKPCEVCGDSDARMHHEDYCKPLEITWLCIKCHTHRHNGRGVGK